VWNFVAVSDDCGRLLFTLEMALLALGFVSCEVILDNIQIFICSFSELMTDLHAAVLLILYQFYMYTNSLSRCYKDGVAITN
jgi:hypothetical protein